jgi:hypothetical protein
MATWGQSGLSWADPGVVDTTYTDLLADIALWLNRDDLTAVIPSFLRLCEADMNSKLRLRSMLTTVSVTAAGGALPSDCLAVKSVGVSGYDNLGFVTPNEAAAINLASAGDTATWWTVDGNTLVVSPTQTTGTVSLRYYARIPALTPATTATAVLVTNRGIYLYGSLVHSAPYLGDDQRLSLWQTLYDQALSALQQSDDAAEYPGPLVIRANQW